MVQTYATLVLRNSIIIHISEMLLEACKASGIEVVKHKGIFSLGSYLGDSDVLFQFLKDHKLVPASQKCPKCESEITINNNDFFRCHRQRIRGASTVNYCLPTFTNPSPNNLSGTRWERGGFGWGKVDEMLEKKE